MVSRDWWYLIRLHQADKQEMIAVQKATNQEVIAVQKASSQAVMEQVEKTKQEIKQETQEIKQDQKEIMIFPYKCMQAPGSTYIMWSLQKLKPDFLRPLGPH